MKKVVVTLISLAVLLLVGVGGYFGWKYYGPIYAAEEAVKLQLKDPSSAQFRNVRNVGPKSMGNVGNFSVGTGVCGEVNTKNLFGVYRGFAPFFVVVPNFPVPFQEPKEDAAIYKEKVDEESKQGLKDIEQNIEVVQHCFVERDWDKE